MPKGDSSSSASKGDSSSSASKGVKRILDELADLKMTLQTIKTDIAHREKEAEHPVYGRSAKVTLMKLYDQQVLLRRREKALEKNAEGYSRAIARGTRSSSGSVKSGRSRSSSKSSQSSASSCPANDGWWCYCGTLNYTNPQDQFFCWGCKAQTFNEANCWWALEPHPDDTSPWEIDMADPMANANNYAHLAQ